MNKKQLTVAWIVGILIVLGAILSTYDIDLKEENPLLKYQPALTREQMKEQFYELRKKGFSLDEIKEFEKRRRGKWPLERLELYEDFNPFSVANKLIRHLTPILIIGGLLIYTLRDKKKP